MSSEIFFQYKTIELSNQYNKFYDPAENIQSLLVDMSNKGWRLKEVVSDKYYIFEKLNPEQIEYIAKLNDYLSK
jgi:hypothetical protein